MANSNNTDENGRFKDVSSKEIKDTIENDKARRLEMFKRTPPPPVKEKVKKTRRKKNYVEKAPNRKTLRATLGIGARTRRRRAPREATSKDIRRAGIRGLRGGNKRFARFINARYGAKAIAKYNDYAGRLRRSKRLIKQIVQIDANTFRIRRHIIKTDTAGNNPYSCTCPDFSQFSSEESRDWFGSKAGPFNPCKHMMAVRDRNKNANGKWVCSNGVCTLDPNATEGYTTKAECESKIRRPFDGGQCTDVLYFFTMYWQLIATSSNLDEGINAGDVLYTSSRFFNCAFGGLDNKTGNVVNIYGPIGKPYITFGTIINFACHNQFGNPVTRTINTDSILPGLGITTELRFRATATRCDGLNDECGNLSTDCDISDFLGCTDPSANNYIPVANTDDGSCTYTVTVLGCTDPSANNYDPLANTDDGSCTYTVLGCTDPSAINYDPLANTDDGSCTYTVLGCTDPSAINYDPLANTDDGSCTY